MPIPEETLAAVQDALERSVHIDASRVTIRAEGDELVLVGSVPTASQVDVAATVAETHADAVRTALEVDRGLREDPTTQSSAEAPHPEDPGSVTGTVEGIRPGRRSTADDDLSTQISEFRPLPVTDDLTPDEEEALAENIAWDPPDTPHSAPSSSEQRGTAARDADTGEPSDSAPEVGEEEPSLPSLSRAELARDARSHSHVEEDRR